MHRILSFILPLFLIVLGLGIYFYLTSEPLSEKQFAYKGKQFSILAPKTFQIKETEGATVLGKGEDILVIAVGFVEKKSDKRITCYDLKTQKTERAFTVNVKSLTKEVEVCKTPDLSDPGYLVLDTPELTDSNFRYILSVHIKDDYFETKKGQGKIKRIIESFKIEP